MLQSVPILTTISDVAKGVCSFGVIVVKSSKVIPLFCCSKKLPNCIELTTKHLIQGTQLGYILAVIFEEF